ncbi:MAG: class II fumarate hydratase [Thermoguttaceae bacterium]
MRTEHDTMGDVLVPQNAYYGAQTQRAVENFPVSGTKLPLELVRAIGLVKWAAVIANAELGAFSEKSRKPLNAKQVDAVKKAAYEVYSGNFDTEFPIDVYQTGSGTSSNMNANEVIANRAAEILGFDWRHGDAASSSGIHPNDHVNFGQSTNDTFPTAIHVAVALLISRNLIPALKSCAEVFYKKSNDWQHIMKIGRTHLADATPITLGQEFSGFARQIELAVSRAENALKQLLELPVGGTAVGTGINCCAGFGTKVAQLLETATGVPFVEAVNHFEANAQRDGLVASHAEIKSIAVTLLNIANNIRFLSSGPRCGFYEIILPDLQPGSSIMPGKVNPVLCESAIQVASKVIGNDTTVSLAGSLGGQFQLNIMMPLLGDVVIESVKILSGVITVFTEKCLSGIEANEENCKKGVEKSLAIATGLNTYIGYEKAAKIVKEAFRSGKTVREVCVEMNIASPEKLDEYLDPEKMIKPLE